MLDTSCSIKESFLKKAKKSKKSKDPKEGSENIEKVIDTTCIIESLINKDPTYTKETKKSSDKMKKAERELIENHKRDKKGR